MPGDYADHPVHRFAERKRQSRQPITSPPDQATKRDFPSILAVFKRRHAAARYRTRSNVAPIEGAMLAMLCYCAGVFGILFVLDTLWGTRPIPRGFETAFFWTVGVLGLGLPYLAARWVYRRLQWRHTVAPPCPGCGYALFGHVSGRCSKCGTALPPTLTVAVRQFKPAPTPVPRASCLECRYDLTGNTSGRCPECGTPCSPQPAAPDPRRPGR